MIGKVKKNKGFTLIELLVSVALFSITVASASSLFAAAARTQRKSLETQKVLDAGRYVMETIAKGVRMSQIANPPVECGATNPYTCLQITNHATKGTVTYSLGTNRVQEASSLTGTGYLSPANVKIERFNFYIAGVGTSDNIQPRVTIVMRAKSIDAIGSMYKAEVDFETTISQRNLDTD